MIRGLFIALCVALLGIPVAYKAGEWKGGMAAEAKYEAQRQATGKIVEYVERVVTVKDEKAVKALKAKLAVAQAETKELKERLNRHVEALPVDDSACRIPDGLRNDLNGVLAGDGGAAVGTDAAVPEGDSVQADDGRQEGHGWRSDRRDRGVPRVQGSP